ncbi:hypothetical protein O3M35_000072 [Rhynocoris fuscipes]|uniref:Uncharacterized protein n=1 Tax=Rhynocoris fuscipes TaxID=488301 RepID=A0AAW1DKU5_9HEMI
MAVAGGGSGGVGKGDICYRACNKEEEEEDEEDVDKVEDNKDECPCGVKCGNYKAAADNSTMAVTFIVFAKLYPVFMALCALIITTMEKLSVASFALV